jgi:formylglycine-generating enzyme
MKHLCKKSLLILIMAVDILVFAHSQTTTQKMKLIPGGQFQMGKNTDHPSDFGPAHQVKVDSFYMDEHEITNAEYFDFCKATGYRLPEFWGQDIFRSGEKFPDFPVVGVSWFDAASYAKWAGKRLPTEAEWECAARGGLVDNEYPNGNEFTIPLRRNTPDKPWENLIIKTETYDSNAFGLYDMSCNVWEWVSDFYSDSYYSQSQPVNPAGPAQGTLRVIRGGSWHSGAMCDKVYYRKCLPPVWVDFSVGFRCAKNL